MVSLQLEMGELGEAMAEHDSGIYKSMAELVEKEAQVLEQYRILNEIKEGKNGDHLSTEFLKLLEAHKLHVLFKIQTKEEQCQSLRALIDYFDTLDTALARSDRKCAESKLYELVESMEPYRKVMAMTI